MLAFERILLLPIRTFCGEISGSTLKMLDARALCHLLHVTQNILASITA